MVESLPIWLVMGSICSEREREMGDLEIRETFATSFNVGYVISGLKH